MNLLIRLVTARELISYEAMSLAMTMATFDHNVQLYCSANVLPLLLQLDNRIHGMLQSLDLYDIPPMWLDISGLSEHSNFLDYLSDELKEQIAVYQDTEFNSDNFDTILTF